MPGCVCWGSENRPILKDTSGQLCVLFACLRVLKEGANPQRISTEIIIEIKQLYSGRIASKPFIASNRRYMVFPLRDFFFIENGL